MPAGADRTNHDGHQLERLLPATLVHSVAEKVQQKDYKLRAACATQQDPGDTQAVACWLASWCA